MNASSEPPARKILHMSLTELNKDWTALFNDALTNIQRRAKIPGVARDSIVNEGSREINYAIIYK
jgi:hypothetical protein